MPVLEQGLLTKRVIQMDMTEQLFYNLPYDSSRASLPVPYREYGLKALLLLKLNLLGIIGILIAVVLRFWV